MKTLLETLEAVPEPKALRENLIEFRIRTVSWSSLESLSSRLRIAPAALVELIGLADRTALRRQKEGFLKPDEADRVLRVSRVFDEAIRVFGSEQKAASWLGAPSVVFARNTPLSLLGSDAGAQAVSEELIRIDFGDFA